MIIKTNLNGEGIPAFFSIEKERAEEMIKHFEAVAKKWFDKLHDDIEASYKDKNSTGVLVEYNAMIEDHIYIAATTNEAAYAAYCAAGTRQMLDEYGDETNNEFGIINRIRESLIDD